MHIHLGIAHLVTAFIGIVLIGTFWRFIAAYLVTCDSMTLQDVGKAMGFMY